MASILVFCPEAAGGILWLEFVYEDMLEKARDAFASPNTSDDAQVLEELKKSLNSSNGWSPEYNEALVSLLSFLSQGIQTKTWPNDH